MFRECWMSKTFPLVKGEHKEFVRAKFDEDVDEGLMDRMTLDEFKAKFGEHRAIAALAVIDNPRPIGAKHRESEHGYMGCQIDEEETIPGDPDSQLEGTARALSLPFGAGLSRIGYQVEWLGMETDYKTYRLGMSEKQASWLANWLAEKTQLGKITAKVNFLEGEVGKTGPWFSLEVDRSWAPWAFAKCDPKKVIAALELLVTLVGIRLWVPEGEARKTSRVAIRGYTDNKSNEALLQKAMTTKYPSMLILMETSEELSQKNCELRTAATSLKKRESGVRDMEATGYGDGWIRGVRANAFLVVGGDRSVSAKPELLSDPLKHSINPCCCAKSVAQGKWLSSRKRILGATSTRNGNEPGDAAIPRKLGYTVNVDRWRVRAALVLRFHTVKIALSPLPDDSRAVFSVDCLLPASALSLSQCIGVGNYRPWVVFVVLLHYCFGPFPQSPHPQAAASLAALTSVWLLILLALHAYLALTGLTTLEWAKGLPPGAASEAEPRCRLVPMAGEPLRPRSASAATALSHKEPEEPEEEVSPASAAARWALLRDAVRRDERRPNWQMLWNRHLSLSSVATLEDSSSEEDAIAVQAFSPITSATSATSPAKSRPGFERGERRT
ncbi:ATP5C1 [Symbiodinium sp. CCMP2456]|nr:ATP5C1 [Symbiodinium sp. CCMP2456]